MIDHQNNINCYNTQRKYQLRAQLGENACMNVYGINATQMFIFQLFPANSLNPHRLLLRTKNNHTQKKQEVQQAYGTSTFFS